MLVGGSESDARTLNLHRDLPFVAPGAHYSVLFFIGVELFVFTFVLNSVAGFSVRRLVRRMSGAAA